MTKYKIFLKFNFDQVVWDYEVFFNNINILEVALQEADHVVDMWIHLDLILECELLVPSSSSPAAGAIVLSSQACPVYIFWQTPTTGIGAVGALESNHWPKEIRLDFVLAYLSKETKMRHLLLLLLPIALTQVQNYKTLLKDLTWQVIKMQEILVSEKLSKTF